MGQPGIVNTGTIYFKEASDAKEAFPLIAKWVADATDGAFEDEELRGDYNIYDLQETEHCWIDFKADSGRVQNLEWQMENFRDFCKTLKNCVGFEAPIMVESDGGIYWEADEEEELV